MRFVKWSLVCVMMAGTAWAEGEDSASADDLIVQDDEPVMTSVHAGGGDESSRLERLEDEMRKMNGRLEEIQHALTRKNPPEEPKDLTHRKDEPALAPLPVAGEGLVAPKRSYDGLLTPTAGGTKAADAGSTLTAGPAQVLYAKAQEALTAGDYTQAEAQLKNLISQHPKDPLVINARYWLGETYYVQSDYARASIAFAEAYRTYKKLNQSTDPKDVEAKKMGLSKAQESLVKLAFSLKGLGKVDDARATLEQLRTEFPHMPQNVKQMAEKAGQGL